MIRGYIFCFIILVATFRPIVASSEETIAAKARSYIGRNDFSQCSDSGKYCGGWKCNIFVAHVMEEFEVEIPKRHWFAPRSFQGPLGAGEWNNPNSTYLLEDECWEMVTSDTTVIGDVVASGSHVGIVASLSPLESTNAGRDTVDTNDNNGWVTTDTALFWRYRCFKTGVTGDLVAKHARSYEGVRCFSKDGCYSYCRLMENFYTFVKRVLQEVEIPIPTWSWYSFSDISADEWCNSASNVLADNKCWMLVPTAGIGDVVANPETFAACHVGIVTSISPSIMATSANCEEVKTDDMYQWASGANAIYWRYICFRNEASSGANIAARAENYVGSTLFSYKGTYQGKYRDSNKCNMYVAHVLNDLEISIPKRSWYSQSPLGAGEWANANSTYLTDHECWVNVRQPAVGDVVGNLGTWTAAHVGIITQISPTILATSANDKNVATNNKANWASGPYAVYWRYTCFGNSGN